MTDHLSKAESILSTHVIPPDGQATLHALLDIAKSLRALAEQGQDAHQTREVAPGSTHSPDPAPTDPPADNGSQSLLLDPADPKGDAHRACKRAGMVAVKVPYGHDAAVPMREYASRVYDDGRGLAADYIEAIADGLDAQEALR